MSDKTYILSIGYQHLVVENPSLAVQLLECQIVDREYVNSEEVYTPSKSERIEVKTVKKAQLRSLTTEERENKELTSAKQSAKWNEERNKELMKQVEELKCQLKVALSKGGEENVE